MRLGGTVEYYIEAGTISDIIHALEFGTLKKLKVLVLGEGSNIVFDDRHIPALVIKPAMKEIEVVSESKDYIKLKVGAGYNWDLFVQYCVNNNYWGLENMSLIPGTVGALPVQNVGAYGQDASQIISSVQLINRHSKERMSLVKEECDFGWRTSIFNKRYKNQFLITHVTFELKKSQSPNLKRVDLKKEVNRLLSFEKKELEITQKLIREAVINLRTSGIPLPIKKNQFNTGTFFRAMSLKKKDYPKIGFKILMNYGILTTLKSLGYRIKYGKNDSFILPSALLLRKSKIKKSKSGNFYLFNKNPAVLIHNGKGTYLELLEFVNLLKDEVLNKIGLEIPVEPNIINA